MKIVFSTKNVSRASFLDTCRYAFDYGFEGFEIYDAIKERSVHNDSILRRDRVSDAKRKLVNRNLEVSALRMPEGVESENTTSELIEKYVDMASVSGASSVIVRIEEKTSFEVLDEKLSAAIKKAEKLYPAFADYEFTYSGNEIKVVFPEGNCAMLTKIEF